MAETCDFLATKRYAVVTGANKGIGLETCRQMASKGVIVVLTARDEKMGLEAFQKLQKSGLSDNLVFHQFDVTDPLSIASIAAFIKTQFGKLDILVKALLKDHLAGKASGGSSEKSEHSASVKLNSRNLVFGADKDRPVTYEDASTASAIESFALEQLEINVGPAEVTELNGILLLLQTLELFTRKYVMEEKCGSAAICSFSFLPDILDSKAQGRNKYMKI